MKMTTKLIYLNEKFENFKKFLKGISHHANIFDSFTLMNQDHLVQFSQFVLLKVKPSINDLDIFIDSLLREKKVEVKLMIEEREKIKRYLTLFVELLS